jgi:hypothetical protein
MVNVLPFTVSIFKAGSNDVNNPVRVFSNPLSAESTIIIAAAPTANASAVMPEIIFMALVFFFENT